MSKNIVIQEGGVGKQLVADKLKTNLVGGGSCLWVPEDEVILGTKSIIHNGTYSASADGLTGFSQVNVNVQGDSVTGKDPVTGQEKTVTVDPVTGNLEEEVIPSEIRVITPPTNPYGTYIDGQTITKDGMVVKGYDANGVELQTIPNAEITLNPTTAVYDPDTDGQYTPPSGFSPEYFTTVKAGYSGAYNYTDNPQRKAIWYAGDDVILVILTRSDGSSENGYIDTYFTWLSAEPGKSASSATGSSIDLNNVGTTLVSGTQFYYRRTPASPNYKLLEGPINYYPNGAGLTAMAREVATIIFDGEHTAGSPQTITVSWPRAGDGKVLETTFDINVGPRAGQGDD